NRLHTDNAALRRENERLTADNLRAQALEQENEQLSTLLQLKSSFSYQTAAAVVIARESSELRRTVTVSKGSDDGIAKGDVVIAEGGALVGRVTDVGPNFAIVTLISDRTSTVVGQTETNAAIGDVVGQLGGALIMQNIDSTETVQPGEQVLTAGIQLPGGTATRLFPLTIVTNKHLLPIYDRPMIYYPIETLAGMGIREVLVIVGGKSVGDVVELLADGSHFGLDLTYRYQHGALGIAHAIGLARD